MATLNKIQIIGNVGSDQAEVRQVGQTTVAKFSVATTERFKKADGTQAEETTWHRVELWGNAGVHPYIVKGTPVYIEGSYKTNDWVDQQNVKHRDYYIKAFGIQLLGQKPQAQQPAPAPQYQQTPPPPAYPQPSAPPQSYQPRPVQPAPPAAPQYQPAPQPPQAPAQPQYQPTPGYPPMNAPEYTQSNGSDLPFSQSPGVRG